MVSQEVLNDLFGAFPDAIMNRNLEFVADPDRRYRDEGIGFLLEGMAAMGFKIVDGVAMLYLDEDGNAYKPKKGELMDGN